MNRLVLLIAGLALHCHSPRPRESTNKIERELAELAEVAKREHAYLGSGPLVALQARLDRIPETEALRRARVMMQIGLRLLQVGDEPEAVRILGAALERLRSHSQEPVLIGSALYLYGLAFLRLGERENCCERTHEANCILPLRGGALHSKTEGSKAAIEKFTEVLELLPASHELHRASRWLLNVAHMTLGSHPEGVPSAHVIRLPKGAEFPRFANRARAAGVGTFDMAGGVIADDFNGDGYPDLLVSSWDPRASLRLYWNTKNGFVDGTKSAGLERLLGGLNLVQADYDNDGDLDFLVLRGAWLMGQGRQPNSLVRNNGDGTFTDVSYDSGIAGSDFPTQTAAWADYDLDGDLDVYIGNESSLGIRELENAYRPGGLATLIAPSQLFRNEGDGQFVDVALDAGVRNGRYSKGVVWGDFDNDGDPDLYVSNIAGENRLYRNNRDGTFTDVAPELGVTGPSSSFAVWFFDVENDGDLDLYVPSYGGSVDDVINGWLGEDHRAERSRLYVNTGDGGFVEKAGAMGLSRASKPMGANFGDLDGDGALDIYLGTGAPDYSFLVPNVMYRNAGSHFEDVTLAGGFGHLQKGHGVAFVDLDLDGDVDVYEQMGGAYSGDAFSNALYENPGFERSWIELDLEGRRSNRDALLASVRVKLSRGTQTRSVYRTVSSGGSFGSNPRRVHVGFDRDWTLGQVEVVWPLGEKQVFRVEKDSHWRLIEGVEKAIPLRLSRRKL